ncbi:MAG: ABC transporter ATP-binding protein [Pseudotabrizicola sp.]|uniref:ABC transporter ATP-binding protein n=1 Tax=Pseudotabrizicola sp. TaxID=2939647 RepID=UPI00271C0DA6|nr:ABC transporter ATP-binding protein [Pseudotabrizicola sp.]MDO8883132.1 ABC transporter ATP-binding protein [Pseudotabrizicola sp.]MDP2081220.1 ABC transporter ATP-binding protein [Pseudotabrizicola sp.]MDZ7576161.1 ABC transporter ATP-binding protein [Pseudotabrizicola sp.]
MAAVIEARGLTRYFGGLRAVDGVDFRLQQGEIHGLIGPNGAGKTTFVSLLSGRVPVQSGSIMLNGTDITHMPAHLRVRAGVAYTFQITSVYPRLSVFDNVALAAQSRGAGDVVAEVADALNRVGMAGLEQALAGTLSYGHQRLLEVAMGLALQPSVLILDEPTQGLASGEIAGFKALIRSLVPQTTILLIEHNMDVVMDLADRITVLNFGQVLAVGTPEEIRMNRVVQDAYLGVDHAAG